MYASEAYKAIRDNDLHNCTLLSWLMSDDFEFIEYSVAEKSLMK